jgi:hypothetical protein
VRASVDDALQAALQPDPNRRPQRLALLAAALPVPAASASAEPEAAPADAEDDPAAPAVSPVVSFLSWGTALTLLSGALGWLLSLVFPPR